MVNDYGEQAFQKSFWEHLEELRKRLLFCIAFVFVGSIVIYFSSSETIFSFVARPLTSLSQKIYFLSPYEAFMVKLQVAFWGGFFLSVPLLVAEAWLFIAPGLYSNERKTFLALLAASLLLFAGGASLAFFAVVPATMRFFLGFATAELVPLISVGKYLSFTFWLTLAFGLALEMPLLLVGLVKFRLLEVSGLQSFRPYLIVGIFLFSAVVTPTPDPVTQCLLAIPLWGLFEAAILIAGAFAKSSRASIRNERNP